MHLSRKCYYFLKCVLKKKQVQIELEDEEKLIISILKTNNNKMDLGFLKVKSELSGKKWDKAMKTLSQHGMTTVKVEGESKIVELKE